MELSAWSLLPPLAAIVLAMWTRQVILSLAAGILLGGLILASGHPGAGFASGVEAVVAVFSEPGQTRLVLFALLIGPLVRLMEVFGGVAGFVTWIEGRNLVASRRGARMLAWGIGLVLFIETNITLLVTGAVCRPLFDRHGESRPRLAYLADSTSAPVCILIPFNAWGALILGLLAGQGIEEPLSVFAAAVPLNFYALAAVALAGFSAWSGWAPGPMARAQPVATDSGPDPARMAGPGKAANMVVPLAVLLVAMPVGLWVTGHGNLTQGSGSTAALWAVLAALGCAAVLVLLSRRHTLQDVMTEIMRGLEGFLGMVVILVLAMALGQICDALGTGAYVAGLLTGVAQPALLLPLTFLLSAVVAFATGTSWGTFAIMVPLAIATASSFSLPPAPLLAAVLSGGIFGDHASPISDTTVVASLASGCEVIDHVRTQMPFALLAAALALVAFAICGALLGAA
ncbi:MAG: C4-dicarboxylate ABC transporter [Acidobacteria bacterium]|nr:C4-dicarboxylate ABC transporter [Acidobacteriota bacterium]